MTETALQTEPLLLDASGVAALLSISRSAVWSWHSSGTLAPLPIRLGRRTLWRRSDIEKFVALGCPGRDRFLRLLENAK
jgi:predicted DNA-binding transcriptional regulator AlpA